MSSVRVGFFPRLTQLTGGSGHPEPLEAALPLISDAPVDHLCVKESLYPDLTCFGCGHANPHGFHGKPVLFVTGSFEVTLHRSAPLGPTVRLTTWPETAWIWIS